MGLSAGIIEELGWTGFAIPTLSQRYGSMTTGLIVGIWWSAWHLLPNMWSSRAASGELAVSLYLSATARGVFIDYLTAFALAASVWIVVAIQRSFPLWSQAQTNGSVDAEV